MKEGVFVRHREKKNKRIFFDMFFHLIKVSHWNQEGAHLSKNLGNRKRIVVKIFGCENQVT